MCHIIIINFFFLLHLLPLPLFYLHLFFFFDILHSDYLSNTVCQILAHATASAQCHWRDGIANMQIAMAE